MIPIFPVTLIKRIPNLRYIGRGSNGHWELKE